jgi:predicted metal-dependent hydrolase
MNETSHSITWAGQSIHFHLRFVPRKRIAIEVNPDLSVLVRAPLHAEQERVLDSVRKKARWILRQQRFFRGYQPRTPERTYVSGEAHLYLGRTYRLKIHATDDDPRVSLQGGYLHVYCPDPTDVAQKRELLEGWYRGHAERVFPARLAECMDHRQFRELDQPSMQIRKLKRRWGSCTPGGRILLNLDLIRAPRRCIDYVIVHELCHLLVPDHSAEFQRLLLKVMPDWEERKAKLEASLI